MKILIFFQHYWPDSPPYATMLRMLGEEFADTGHQIHVITYQPSHKEADRLKRCDSTECTNGVTVSRLPLLPGTNRHANIRLLGKLLFPFRAFFAVLIQKLRGAEYDLVIASTIPPVLNGLLGFASSKVLRAKFIYHIQDIYPELLTLEKNNILTAFLVSVLLRIDRYTVNSADMCVVLSDDMANSINQRKGQQGKICVINNFMLSGFQNVENNDYSAHQARLSNSNPIKFVFAGNLGRFQSLDLLVNAFASMSSDTTPCELHIVGDGVMSSYLRDLAKNTTRIHFHGFLDFNTTSEIVKNCDAGIFSIKPKIYKYAYPSKIITYLGLGIPVVGLVEKNSEIARTIESNSIGFIIDEKNHDSIRKSFEDIAIKISENMNTRQNVNEFYKSTFSTKSLFTKWHHTINSLSSDSAFVNRSD